MKEKNLNLRLFPLLYIGFRNLKVDPLNRLAATHNFNAAQKVFKIIQNAAGSLQEAGQPVRDVMYKLLCIISAYICLSLPRIAWHVLRKVC